MFEILGMGKKLNILNRENDTNFLGDEITFNSKEKYKYFYFYYFFIFSKNFW